MPPYKEGHRFDGWDKAFDNVQTNLDVNAKFEVGGYNVKFFVDGVQYGPTQKVEYGDGAELPAPPTKQGFTFIKWDHQTQVVIKDIDAHAN